MIEWGQGESPGRLTLRTPAKVNLGLRLVGQRADGYHLIESVFAPIDLYDEIELAWHAGPDEIQFALEFAADAELPPGLSDVTAGPDNLVVRAAEAFREASGQAGTLEIRLRKRIPAGAGLGGGSSDAGAVLAGLARLVGTDSPDSDALAAIALQLGADVPYFLAPQPAFVSGIGEQIEPIDSLPSFALVIANPGISVATAEVYRVADLLRDSLTEPEAGSTMRAISRLRGDIADQGPALADLLVNDLEPAAIRLCPPIGRLLGRLKEAGALSVVMSGSGGTVFGVFPDREAAEMAAKSLRVNVNTKEEQVSGVIVPHEAFIRVTRILSDFQI